MRNFRKTTVCGALLLFGAAACADLDVVNTNDPDRERALATAGDVESLIAGSWQRWYLAEHSVAGPNLFLSAASFQHSASAANFGMLTYSALPRSAVINEVTHADYANISYAWTTNYRALAAVAEGLRSIDENPQIATDLGAAATLRARIFGKLVQGLSHASVALLYDRGYAIDETVETIDESGAPVLLGEPIGYQALMTAALGYFDQAIALSNQPGAAGITIPHDWMPLLGSEDEYTMPELRRLIYSMKARYRANNARTAAERAAVNWAAVLSDVGNGTHTDILTDESYTYTNWLGGNHWLFYVTSATWQQATYFINGMADQSGNYQAWLAQPLASREPNINGNVAQPVVIVTPDLRFPQGATLAAQNAAPGRYLFVRSAWSRPDRGTWKWSWYANRQATNVSASAAPWPEVEYNEMRFLAAEALFRSGQLQQAADSINITRVFNGLNATNAAGLNTSCVPKLPNGTCGNLFEMLKWEVRMETWLTGPYRANWYFLGRGTNGLFRGTPEQFPIPAEQIQVSGLGEAYTFGGVGGQSSAPTSMYNWNGES
ncbi:MAG TPA: hypothetical protein VFR37_01905 [Longimicrobium sp.]|nr:hypothetical protein [Longimicrobium sp.]